MNTQISIVGCGWLGFPLAEELIKCGFKVKGTTTSKDKLERLIDRKIEAYFLKITSETIVGPIEDSLLKSEVLVINIPPGLGKNPDQNYVALIKNLISHIEAARIKKVLFISSTSVYSDEESFPEITEDTKPNPETESGKQLLKVEALLQNNTHFDTTILRFSGLFGKDRHPAKHLSGKTNLKNAKAPVNLIHLTDAIQIIVKIIKLDVFGETFIASTLEHPTRQDYYNSVCESMNLAAPIYDLTQKSQGKIIRSNKLQDLLNYQFQIKL
ncbi:NAD-dependent epimerase/dehydratase family protein [Flavobacteriaceae bacterium LMO-SS05]